MKKLTALCLLLLALAPGRALAAEGDTDAKRLQKLHDTRAWLTNEFTPWLTNTFPTVTFEHWPDWLVNPPSRTRLPTWLTNTFPEIESEDFPFWLKTAHEDQLAKGIPDFWNDVKTKVRTVPQAKNLPVITRGPYLQLGTTNSMVVRWRTAQPRSSVVKYGRAPDRLSKEARASGTLTEHVVLFTNLQPDTKYFYSIGERDTPMLVWLTNDLARIATTNGTLYVSSRSTNLEIAAATNGALLFSHQRGRLSVATEDGKFKRDTTNGTLLVSTLTSLLNLSVSNGALAVTSSDHIVPMDGGEVGKRAKTPTRHFAVGTTNRTFAGADSNTFFVTHPPIGPAKPTRIWVLGDPGTRKKEQFHVRDAYYKWNGDRSTDLWIMLGDNA